MNPSTVNPKATISKWAWGGGHGCDAGDLRCSAVGLLLSITLVLAGGCGEQPMGGASRGVSGAGERAFGEPGTSPGQFVYPRAIDTDGRWLWIVDKTARVQRLDPKTGRCRGGLTMPDSALGKPTGVTVGPGPDGSLVLYLPDTHYHRVMVVQPPAIVMEPSRDVLATEPDIIATFGSYGTEDGQFIYPTDVAVLPQQDGNGIDRIYVSEYGGNDRVSVFDSQYQFLFSFGSFGSSTEPDNIQFNRPQALSLDVERGELLVADACNHRLGRFTLQGKLIAWIGAWQGPGDGAGSFTYPYGLVRLSDSSVLVSEFGGNRVQRIMPETGQSLGFVVDHDSQDGSGGLVLAPWGVTVIGRDAFVLDSARSRVVRVKSPARGVVISRGGGGGGGGGDG